MEQRKELASKVILSTGKEVIFREYKIKHQELAVMAAAPRAGDNQFLLMQIAGKELIKLLIMQINGKDVRPIELEDLDSVFTAKEYSQLQRVVKELTGDDDGGKYQLEVVSFGGI